VLRILIAPLGGTHWGACCVHTKFDQNLESLLAFGNENGLLVGNSLSQLRQTIQDLFVCLTARGSLIEPLVGPSPVLTTSRTGFPCSSWYS
jgi:hypothetical protein